MALGRVHLLNVWLTVGAGFVSGLAGGCKSAPVKAAPSPDVRVSLVGDGLSSDYARHDPDDCTTHVISYRSIVWLSDDRVAVVFSTSPSCRPSPGERIANGTARLLVFDAKGSLRAKRDIEYNADGGDELVTSGEVMPGPDNTLLVRIEEAGNSKSGVRLFDRNLDDVGRIDRFMETPSVIDHSLVFQEGVVWRGPRTYDVYDGDPPVQVNRLTEDWPAGTMDRRVGRRGAAFALCQQELGPNEYRSSNVIYSGAHRRCSLEVHGLDGAAWEAPLKQDEVVELLGTEDDGSVVTIVRGPKAADQLVIWKNGQAPESLPWFPADYHTKLQSVASSMDRYVGLGDHDQQRKLRCIVGISCPDDRHSRLMIFDRSLPAPLLDREFSDSFRVALSPDGMHYATFESGELRIFLLPPNK